ncbi:MAG: heme o synthase [Desulfotomaculales bacterium]
MEATVRRKFPHPQALLGTLKNYIEVTKPRSVFLLVFTSLVTMFLAVQETGPATPAFWLKAILAITLACSGTNAVSCYIDRDLDAGMERTKKRPIPSGRIYPAEKALFWGIAQFLFASAIAWTLNFGAFICVLMGMFCYIGIYSLWLKRKTPWNIILGGLSGGLPAIFGWVAVTGKLTVVPVLIAILVILWIPNHIWNLAIYFKDDYRRVNVPMLPVVYQIKPTLLFILLTVVLMLVTSLAVYHYGGFGLLYLGMAIFCGTVIFAGNVYLYLRSENKKAWFLYKLSSPYLFLLFLGMLLDRIL